MDPSAQGESRKHATPAAAPLSSNALHPDAPAGVEGAPSPSHRIATSIEQASGTRQPATADVVSSGMARAEDPTPGPLPTTAGTTADREGGRSQIAANNHDNNSKRRPDRGTAQVEHANPTAAGLGAGSGIGTDPRSPGDGARIGRVESPHQLPQLLPHPTQPAPYLLQQPQAQTRHQQAQHQHPYQHPQPAPQHHPQPQHPPAPLASSAPAPAPAPAPPSIHPHAAPHPQPQPLPLPQPHPYPAHPHQYPAHHQHPPAQHAQQHPQPQSPVQIPPPNASQYHHHQQQQHHHHPPQQQPPPATSGTPVTPVTPLPPLHQHQTQFHAHAQPQPAPVLRSRSLSSSHHHHHTSLLSKPPIMDPPRRQSPAQQQQRNGGFPSPRQDYAAVNPKFVDDCTRMNFAIQQSLSEAVRRIVRDHWEKCLLGSEFHQAFILNASIHHALPSVIQRAVRDFGGKMVVESKHELMAHFTTEALDEVADLIISKASDSFLDKCLEKRLLTIEAKPLINALAKAERLGYEPGDVVQDDQHERVIPQEAYPGAAAAANGFHAPPAEPSSAHAQGGHRLQCMKCFRTFAYPTAYEHHTRFDVCSELPPSASGFEQSCPHCGQGFVHAHELQHHLDNQVCGSIRPPADTSRRPSRAAAPALPSTPASIHTTSSQPLPANGLAGTPAISTPAHRSITRTAAAATSYSSTPVTTSSPIAADPYAHLTEEQLAAMNEELLQAEAKYAPRFAEAEAIPDENARRAKIEGLRNSFGTKQSMIRKKFGVRLRERRTKAEITAERERLGLKRAEKERRRVAGAAAGTPPPHRAGAAANVGAAARPVAGGGGAGGGGGGSGWTAANTPRAAANTKTIAWNEQQHDAKRRRVDESGGYQTPYRPLAHDEKTTPTRKTLSVSEMGGGLAGSSATAAVQDPTLPLSSQPTRVYEQAGARVEVHEPASSSGAPLAQRETAANGKRQPAAVVVADDDQEEDDDSSSGDDEDIPSTLPSHVRKSLAGDGTSLLQSS